MNHIGPILAAPGELSLMYAERLLTGVSAKQFARLAQPGGVVVRSNHAAFVIGHLALYPPRIVANLNRPAGNAAYPAGYEALFRAGTECRDDPDGTIYPSMDELTSRFFDGYRTAIRAVREAPDDVFLAPNPAEGRMRELFPTIGAALDFYLSGHVQNHLGQISAWRRAMGMPAA